MKNHLILAFFIVILTSCAGNTPTPNPTDSISNTIVPTPQMTSTHVAQPTQTEAPLFPTPIQQTTSQISNNKNYILEEYLAECYNGQATPTCVYSPGVFQLYLEFGNNRIPDHDYIHARAWEYAWSQGGVAAINAHDYLAGSAFFNLQINSFVYLVFGNQTTYMYQINEITRWRDTYNWTVFKPWDGGDPIEDDKLYERYYKNGSQQDKIVLQTCININDGIIFIKGDRLK